MADKRILHTCTDSPPGRAVQIVLKHLDVPYSIKTVDFDSGEHLSDTFLKMYPQGEIPVLDEDGLIIGESVAIILYLVEKYGRDETFYPKCPVAKSVIHHRLAFHLSTFQRRVYDYMVLPMDYAYERTEDNLKKLQHALKCFDEILRRQNTTYVAGDNFTIADPPLIMATAALDAMDFDLKPYSYVVKWYEAFKKNLPGLWDIAKEGRDGLSYFNKHPRNMSHLKHPLHPTT